MNTQVFHLTPYVDPRFPTDHGTSAVLYAISQCAHHCEHNFLMCGLENAICDLAPGAFLVQVRVCRPDDHDSLEKINEHCAQFSIAFQSLLQAERRFSDEHRIFIAHGAEAALFAGKLAEDGISGTWLLQTHFWLSEYVRALQLCGLPHPMLGNLQELMLRAMAVNKVLTRFDKIFVERPQTMEALQADCPEIQSRISIAPLAAIDPNYFRYSLERTARHKILVAGRCSAEKGHYLAVQAWSIAAQQSSAVRQSKLQLVMNQRRRGEYRHQVLYRNYVLELVEKLGMNGHVWISEGLSKTDLANAFINSVAVVVPSIYEPFGLITLEALATGTRVLISDSAGSAAIVRQSYDEGTFRTGDISQIVSSMICACEKNTPEIDRRTWSKSVLNIYHPKKVTENFELRALHIANDDDIEA